MGIFDAVLGASSSPRLDGGLFSSTSSFRSTNVLAAPPPATAHLQALRDAQARGRRKGKARDASDADEADVDSDDVDSDDDEDVDASGKRAKTRKSARRSERESVEAAYEAAAAVMADDGSAGGISAKKKANKGAAAAAASKKKRGDSESDDDGDSDSDSDSDSGGDDSDADGGGARDGSDSDGDDGDDDDGKEDPAPAKPKAKGAKATKTPQTPTDTSAAAEDGKSSDAALPRTLFVGNLPVTIKPKRIKTLFGAYGDVESVRLRSVPVDAEGKMPRAGKVITGKLAADRHSTNAYVVFKEEEAAARATAMNMKEVEGRHIRVDRAAAPSTRTAEDGGAAGKGTGSGGGEVAYDHTRSLFLGNLAYNVDEEDIIRLFHRSKEYPELSGSVEAVRVVRDRKTNLGKGIAFVLFRKSGAARTGLLLDGATLGDRAVRVTRASKNRAAAATTAADKKRKAGKSPRGDAGDSEAPRGAARRLGLSEGNKAAAWEGSRSRPGGKR